MKSSRHHLATEVADFKVLTVQFAPTPAHNRSASHALYIRPDVPKDADASLEHECSLFVANIPCTATESQLRLLFRKSVSSVAAIARIDFSSEARRPTLAVTGHVVVQGTQVGVPIGLLRGKKRRAGLDDDVLVKRKLKEMELPQVWKRQLNDSGGSAVVVFVDKESMSVAWSAIQKLAKNSIKVQWPEDIDGLGLDRYRVHHNLVYPAPTVLQAKVNTFLTYFASLETLRNQQLAKQRNIPDDDGFVTVTRGGRSAAGRVEDAQAAQVRLKERAEKRVGKDFYRFQTREQAKRREGELKRKFEQDRQKVQDMRKRRGKIAPE